MDADPYVILNTANADGTSWTSPVYVATADYAEIFWASGPDSRHSRNLAVRSQPSMVIFESTVPTCHDRAVYRSGTAAELTGRDLDRGIEIFPGDPSRGGAALSVETVTAHRWCPGGTTPDKSRSSSMRRCA
ncbi:MAG TPA: pyridoxamine 5'-phosphate oxidase family protein [Actinophytocola sp.]|nr:pyridoxamine 5'-phosphate oxidase family protein [Actinophytocola sp.]